ncbi:Ugd Predicted UDP-glucose 6-dehydrogenase [uncultured Caudovirales phage]|uniref:Ugd Predicted UDP-glucose 6-dehydrogenase n=1 Tax=uncultured Caudovirales phage TaxID=2100421 RepID=A0A6J5LYK3_9CAUD|nr:Ugd Predicted UDP-glucose 6-dehydrogenase [uncultured Caudovirales phage]
MKKNIGFIGLGKLGLDCAEVMAEKHTVRGYDIYPRTSDMVKVCDINEVVNESEWIFIAVPTPHEEGYDGSVPSSHMTPKDFGHDAVKDAIAKVNQHATTPKKVVLISTVLPGTTRKYFVPMLDSKHQFLYNPYLIAMGSVKWDMVNPEMIMIGTEDGNPNTLAGELIDIYKTIMQNSPRYEIGTWDECEAIKIFYNTFISAKVGLANMIQDFAMKIGNINVDVVTNALARSTMRIMGPKYMTAGMGDAGACHPRDNIALRWLAQEYEVGYDLFDTIMHAREIQAKNLAEFLVVRAQKHNLPIVIHGKAYKPDVPYCIGSYSTLVGYYVEQAGHRVTYVDPLADDSTNVVATVDHPAVFLWAHNRRVTYEYTGDQEATKPYCEILPGSIIVDPWRQLPRDMADIQVVHYGNTRS